MSSGTIEWPSGGSISFSHVFLQYRNNPPALKGISFSCKSGERIGVCGRTGAGKSSLMVALFRIAELKRGTISIDGVDISSVPLSVLRSRLSIIPQDPVLFTGDVRFQLDPFQSHNDTEIWDVLDRVNLSELIKSFPKKLNEPIYEGGGNLSQGQRQLLCIARALLRKAKILIVDEGTSAVDPATDLLIQNTLREDSKKRGTTILAIAHRLQTIVDFDRILVLGDGKVLEFDSPENLLRNENSNFAAMMRTHK